MKNNILFKTNLIVSVILLIGFALIATLSYRANYNASLVKIKQVSALASEGIYYRLSTMLTKPVNISQTMAHDSLLIKLLEEEGSRYQEAGYQETLRKYLEAYKNKYAYDAVFLVASATNNYYNFNGLDRNLVRGEAENVWYYDFLSSGEEYNLNIDNDEVAGAANKITLFVNCKIKNAAGQVIGVVGVGVNIDYIKGLLQEYEKEYDVETYLINEQGAIEVSSIYNGHQAVDWFEVNDSENIRSEILDWKNGKTNWDIWMPGDVQSNEKSYLVVRYIPDLSWYLLVKQDTGALLAELNEKMLQTGLLIVVVILLIIFTITSVIRKFNVRMTQLLEERQELFKEATEQIYDNIYELNITKNKAASKKTELYFEALGAKNLPYEEFLLVVAEKQIKKEFRDGYVNTFTRENVLRQLDKGNNYLQYEFMMTENGHDYFWMRIDAYIFYSAFDDSVHMFTYRKNIDAEKRRELESQRKASTDEMTGVYTKKATERIIDSILCGKLQGNYSFFIIDMDNFKQANDLHGHIFGDYCIREFAEKLKRFCREDDVIGRIGGDEFVVFGTISDEEGARRKAARLCQKLDTVCEDSGSCWKMSVSIGIALVPQDGRSFAELYEKADKALYQTKARGKNGYTVYEEKDDNGR
ncbi:MAG: sensor domain-containing diguanylate cyclase [Acidaminococcaceae bacterium]|nr:sensor domain-containing diguanylate cyclase [Acidaminococcaceae bacterium]